MDSPTSQIEVPEFSSVESETFKKEIVIPYFKDIFKDLAQRSDKKDKGINKVTIIEYANLPGILAEWFFSILDVNDDGFIDLWEFIYVMFKIYYSSVETQMRYVFDIFDFDRDGYITPEDSWIVLSYVPISNMKNTALSAKEGSITSEGGGYEDFNTRILVQEEIAE